MTFEEKMRELLIEHGMTEAQVEEVILSLRNIHLLKDYPIGGMRIVKIIPRLNWLNSE